MFGAFVSHRLWSDSGCTTTCITNSIANYVAFGEQIGFPLNQLRYLLPALERL